MSVPTRWLWDFGDGNTSTEQNPQHEYAVAGTYTVTLNAANDAGESTVTKQDYVVVNEPVSDYTHWGTFSCRNGYDGDVGIAGYTPTIPLVQIPGQGLQDSYSYTQLINAPEPGIGGGLIGYPDNNTVPPMPIDAIVYSEDTSGQFLSVRFSVPMKDGDDIWITDAYFPDSGEAYYVRFWVGPYGDFRDNYILNGSAVGPLQTFSLNRQAP